MRTYGLCGLVTGNAAREPVRMSLDARPAYTLAAGTDLIEDFYLVYRRDLHGRVYRLAWLIVGATLFVLLVFTQVYRWSLSRPLEGRHRRERAPRGEVGCRGLRRHRRTLGACR